VSDARAAEYAAILATAINWQMIRKGFGATVTAETTYPGALLLADAEARADRVAAALARLQTSVELLGMPDFTTPARPAGAAGHADSPLDPAEAERVNRVITTFEDEVFG
jgi:hypothetical protein